MQRNRLSITARTTVSQNLPAGFQARVDGFGEFVEKQITEQNMTPDLIINMDEVPLTFGIPMGPKCWRKSAKKCCGWRDFNSPLYPLSEINFIKQAKEQQAAKARRQATPVVGDMRPLADALPELCQLISPSHTKTNLSPLVRPVRRPQPTDFSQMKQSQKRKLLETETSWFSKAVKTLASKKNPLVDIGEQLRKRMRQEEEQGSS
uniref:SLX9 ribosome biogenesis factor n=1 Tax=Nothobranchius furzeri TaxID=105023 RepID=A0A8C6LYY3_NOTFU